MSASGFMKRGRVAQKRRTRQALLDAGVRVVRRGEEPTLQRIASEAGVSRATVYRYFSNRESLLSLLSLADLVREPDEILAAAKTGDAVTGALATQRHFLDMAIDNEAAMRRLVQATLEATLRDGEDGDRQPMRGGYRLRTLDVALRSLEDRGEDVEHLRVALVALSGIEALITVKDVCGLDAETGRKSLEWAARVLVEAVERGDC